MEKIYTKKTDSIVTLEQTVVQDINIEEVNNNLKKLQAKKESLLTQKNNFISALVKVRDEEVAVIDSQIADCVKDLTEAAKVGVEPVVAVVEDVVPIEEITP